MNNNLRPRVFVSCGQADGPEFTTAKELATILEEHGFGPYVARKQASLTGVKEAIFPQLAEAENLLFVDFPRDKLPTGDSRGSLFSHQELALAAYLNLPYIGFRHRTVRLEGLSAFLLANAAIFESETELPALLRQELASREDWHSGWRKQLRLFRADANEGDNMLLNGAGVRFFHLTLENLHRDRMAVGCGAYVERIADALTGEAVPFRPAELKWAGTMLPLVAVPAGSRRDLDACFILFDDPASIRFASFSDSGHHMSPISGRAVDITYAVVSENFDIARCTLRVEPGNLAEAAIVRMT